MEFALKLVYFLCFCFVWYLTPFSTWVLNCVVYMVPRSLDTSIGNSGASSQYYSIVHKYDDRLSTIGMNLVSALPPTLTSGYEFSFQCIDEKYVNAFAYPGGKIYITDELIQDLQVTDDELAAVLAHEIGHVVHRHSIKGLIEPGIVAIAWHAIFYEDDDDHKESFGEAIGEILMKNAALIASLSFSRAHEYEADLEGWSAMLNSAGYNPVGMITLFEKLLQLEPPVNGQTHWDKTHPGTKDRIAKLLGHCGKKCETRKTSVLSSGSKKQPKATSCEPLHVYNTSEINEAGYVVSSSKDGLAQGICSYDNGVYEGEFKDDKMNGRGIYRWTTGGLYDGEWKDGNQHGKGVQSWADGDVYDGEWKDGKKHGRGVYRWANGGMYDGEWKDGHHHGRGVHRLADGGIYDGEYKDGNKYGRGVYRWASGVVYDGEWKDNKKHGRGVYRWANGEVYDGEYKDGKKHGRGVYRRGDGSVYHDGLFKDDKPVKK